MSERLLSNNKKKHGIDKSRGPHKVGVMPNVSQNTNIYFDAKVLPIVDLQLVSWSRIQNDGNIETIQ